MSGRVISVDPLTDPRWDAFVQDHPKAGLFHSSSWIEILQRTYGYQPAHLAQESDGAIQGILPIVVVRSRLTGDRLVSLPFSGPAGPLGSSQAVVDRLAAAAIEATAELGCSYLNIQARDDQAQPSDRRLARSQPLVCTLLSGLGDASSAWASIPFKTVRGQIRRAREQGVSTRVAANREDLRIFYELHIETHRRFGIPPQPYELFEHIWDALQPKGRLWLFLTCRNDRVITAQLCFGFKDVLGALYVGIDYRSLRWHPVKLADWVAIEMACSSGYQHYDFLLTDVGNAGLRWYKRSFGAVEIPVSHYYYPAIGGASLLKNELTNGKSGLSRLVRATVRRMPSPALKLLGRLVFRHMG